MAWKHLTFDDMRLYLAKDELDRLKTSNIDQDLTTVVNDTLDMVSDTFRGAWKSKGYVMDSRDHYTDSAYRPFILAYTRWVLWNRFPAAGDYALTETRKDEFEMAKELLKNPYIGTTEPKPDDPDPDPGLSAKTSDAAISVPWMKFPGEPYDTGFWQVYSMIDR